MSYRERAKQWYERALGEKDPFVMFLLYYVALEVTVKLRDSSIRDLKQDVDLRKYVFSYVSMEQRTELLKALETQPLINENPSGDHRWDGKLDTSDDFAGIIEFIIRARNNLFHGDKGLNEERDRQVIGWANVFLRPIVERLIA